MYCFNTRDDRPVNLKSCLNLTSNCVGLLFFWGGDSAMGGHQIHLNTRIATRTACTMTLTSRKW